MNVFALHGGYLSAKALRRDSGDPVWILDYLESRDIKELTNQLQNVPDLVLVGYSEGGDIIADLSFTLPNIKGAILYEAAILDPFFPAGDFPVLWIRNDYTTLRYREEIFLESKHSWQKNHPMETMTGKGRHIKFSPRWPFFAHGWDQSLNVRINNWINRNCHET